MDNPTDSNHSQAFAELWKDYVNLAEKFREDFDPRQFGITIMAFTVELLYDCAPSPQAAVDAFKEGITIGKAFHEKKTKEKQDDT